MKINNLRSYIKFLSRNKLYSMVSILGFAISLMFVILLSIYVKQELSVDDFQENKDRIYLIGHEKHSGVANIVADDTKELCPEVEDFARFMTMTPSYKESPSSKAIGAEAFFTDSSFFNIFSFPLIEGDPKQALVQPKTVVLTESFAKKIDNGKPLIGTSIYLNDDEFFITGIMKDIPKNSMFKNPDIIVNIQILEKWWYEAILTGDNMWGATVFFLIKEGADIQSKIPLLEEKFKERYWIYRDELVKDVIFTPLKDVYFKTDTNVTNSNSKTQISIYTGIVILILVVALLNYINMTVAQAGSRGKEAAIKKMLGASRYSIVRQMLQESLLMTSFTFLLGLFLAFFAEPFFDEMLNTKIELASQFNFSNISFAVLFIFFISFVAGIIPATVISNFDPIEIVKGSFTRKVKSKYSKILIIFQYVIAIALLSCSFFIKKQSDFMMNYDMGFDRNGILSMNCVVKSGERDALRSLLSQISGVEFVSFSSQDPMDGGSNNTITVDGNQMSFQDFSVDSLFFKVYGITIEPTGVAATNETYWVNQLGYNALNPDPKTNIADFGWDGKRGLAGITSSFNIRPLHQKENLIRIKKLRKEDEWCSKISIRITENADLIVVKNKIVDEYVNFANTTPERIDPKFVDERIEQWYERENRVSSIMDAFTVLTIIIMLMGVFAMSVYLIRQKEKEIGVRKINGATEMQILGMLNFDSLIRLLISFLIACPISYYAMNKWLENFAYKTSLDWWVFVLAGLIVTVLSVISISIQSWRAATANPVESLKSE